MPCRQPRLYTIAYKALPLESKRSLNAQIPNPNSHMVNPELRPIQAQSLHARLTETRRTFRSCLLAPTSRTSPASSDFSAATFGQRRDRRCPCEVRMLAAVQSKRRIVSRAWCAAKTVPGGITSRKLAETANDNTYEYFPKAE